jgi:hypothetical protein
MLKRMTGLAVATALVLGASYAGAADQLIVGKKLLIKNPPAGATKNKLVFLAKDTSIVQPTGPTEDPTVGGGSLTVEDIETGESFTIALPAANWTSNGNNLFKYKDSSGASCKIVLIKDGVLTKAVCGGAQVAYDLGAAQNAVRVVLSTGTTNRYCTVFSAARGCTITKDGSDDKTYLAKNCSAAPSGCSPASPSGAFLDGALNF